MSVRDTLLKRATTREIVEFDAGLGEPFYFRPIKGGVRSKMESLAESRSVSNLSEIRWVVLLDSLCESDGSPVLTLSDRAAFDDWDSSLRETLFEEALRVSGIGGADKEALAGN
jgi:hypothetical protein